MYDTGTRDTRQINNYDFPESTKGGKAKNEINVEYQE